MKSLIEITAVLQEQKPLLASIRKEAFTSLAFTADGRLLVSGAAAGQGQSW